MANKSDWPVVGAPIDPNSDERLFFDEHQWQTIEAAAARIIPTDHDPGAREARVIVYIDRYLSGIDYIYASADGSGFLEMSGKLADAWRARIGVMQETYREGIRQIDKLAHEGYRGDFKDLTDEQQDGVLEALSRKPKPAKMTLGRSEGVQTFLQGVFDEGLEFFDALVLHTKQGFYCDPVYGGNKDQIGWKVIGFPGPKSLKDTNDLTYDTREYWAQEWDWNELIPYLGESQK